jgi:N-acetylneuraminic acid mutarotase
VVQTSGSAVIAWIGVGIAAIGLWLAPAAAQPRSEGWEERASMLTPRSEQSVAELNGRIYTMGGYSGERIASDIVQVYDSRTDSWSYGPSLPGPMHHTMAAAADGRLYIIGGEYGGPGPGAGATVFLDTIYMLEEEAGAWVPRASMPTRRSGGGAAAIDGKIYVAGGRPPAGHHFAVSQSEVDG